LFSSSYTSLKALIPVINPYSWDPFLIKLDAALHFGLQPWELLQPFLGIPLITYLINFLYNLWYFIIVFVFLQQVFSLKDRQLRMQYLLATVGVWSLLGGIMAISFSSVGPCFYANQYGDHETFRPLMDYLERTAEDYRIYSLDTQKYLWDSFTDKEMVLGTGISAMPSMHVSTVFLVSLLAWRKNTLLGIISSIYALLILLGSVHLAWHYAVDGYLSILVTLAVWIVAGKIAGNIKSIHPTEPCLK
jgi:hypothetical protein